MARSSANAITVIEISDKPVPYVDVRRQVILSCPSYS